MMVSGFCAFYFLNLGEMSECHARLVHKLLSQYIEKEGNTWVKKYPTSNYVQAVSVKWKVKMRHHIFHFNTYLLTSLNIQDRVPPGHYTWSMPFSL